MKTAFSKLGSHTEVLFSMLDNGLIPLSTSPETEQGVVFTSRLHLFICVVLNWTLCADTGQRIYEWGLCCAPLKGVCVSFCGLQEVVYLDCSAGVCLRVCVDNVHARSQACESIGMRCRLRRRMDFGENNNNSSIFKVVWCITITQVT